MLKKRRRNEKLQCKGKWQTFNPQKKMDQMPDIGS